MLLPDLVEWVAHSHLAITMNEGVALIAEVEKWRIEKRLETKYLDC